VIALLLTAGALAQDCFVVTDAAAWLPAGRTEGVTIVAEGGRIVSVGARPADLAVSGAQATYKGRACALVAGKDRIVTPGLIEVESDLGLVEVSLEGATSDMDAEQSDPYRAALRVSDAYNPRATAIPVTRVQGVTTAVIVPTGGLVSGQSAAADLAGGSQADAIFDTVVAVHGGIGATGSKAGDWALWRELLDHARLYQRTKGAWTTELKHPEGISLTDLEALQAVLRREIPLVLRIDRAADIEAALRFAREQNVRIVLTGAAEGWLVADQLAAAKVPVVIDATVYGAGSFDEVHGREDNAALLAKAGVPVVISSFSTHNARTLRVMAGNAVRGGLDPAVAIRAITQTPAEAYGLGDRGRLAVGAVANLVVWSGDPLEPLTVAEQVVIEGRVVPEDTRQTELLEKYRKLPGTPLEPLALP
jgi:imidazolonepropionase-like amidohydrolase